MLDVVAVGAIIPSGKIIALAGTRPPIIIMAITPY
jgi:hypothetical protein